MINKNSKKIVFWFVCIFLPLLGQTALAAEAKTHAYTLAAEISVGPTISEDLDIKVPFDSLITGVSISANPRNISYCYASLEYPNASVRPGGSNSNNIARVEIPFIGNGSPHSAGTVNTFVPNMFVGEGVNLDFNAGFGGAITTNSTSVSTGCTVRLVIYLVPASTGVIGQRGGFGLAN